MKSIIATAPMMTVTFGKSLTPKLIMDQGGKRTLTVGIKKRIMN
jgi:hypothetical protein